MLRFSQRQSQSLSMWSRCCCTVVRTVLKMLQLKLLNRLHRVKPGKCRCVQRYLNLEQCLINSYYNA